MKNLDKALLKVEKEKKKIENKLESILPRVEKPGRYIGGEWNSIEKAWKLDRTSVALCFPDTYEIGMSHLGLNIFYELLNKREWILAERCFSPWLDMERELKNSETTLFSLESKTPLNRFDVVAFTLQFELTYTNILNMLDLGKIPLKKEDRDENHPLIIAGGPNAYMPEPLADFVDIFVIGEGEEVFLEILEKVHALKSTNLKSGRRVFLEELKEIEGLYIPAYYEPSYDESGNYLGIVPLDESLPHRIPKRTVKDFDAVEKLNSPIVPNIEIVHDRAVLELFRGCGKGCRFCQAGMVYRPVREASPSHLKELAEKLIKSTGYEDLSLASLSSADYSEIEQLIDDLNHKFQGERVSISLPSLRIDSFSIELLKKIQRVKKTGLTFAPEAGSKRLRDVINKKVSEKDLENACRAAFESGWQTLKLYFMLGLPTETYDDLDLIAELSHKVVDLYKEVNGNLKRFKLNVSTSVFVPKPHTPFQWLGQLQKEETVKRQEYLKDRLKSKVINYSWDDPDKSFLEAFLAKGDRRCAEVIYQAYLNGARFDDWGEVFDMEPWEKAFEVCEIDPEKVVNENLSFEKSLPWDHIDSKVSKEFLLKEYEKAMKEKPTFDCRSSTLCDVCGVCKEELISNE